MRRSLLLIALVLVPGCASSGETPAGDGTVSLRAGEPTWAEWSEMMLRGNVEGELPPIPASGWTRRDGNHWFRHGAQVSDYSGDGRVDYVRLVDPPGSYNHRVWVDHDHDGHFDHDASASRDRRLEVPAFEPARAALAQEATAEGR